MYIYAHFIPNGFSFTYLTRCKHHCYWLTAHHGDDLEIRTIPTIESAYRLEFDQSVWKKNSSENASDAGDDNFTLLVSGKVQMVCVDKDMKVYFFLVLQIVSGTVNN